MSYTARTDVPLRLLAVMPPAHAKNLPDEYFQPSAVFELDTGDLVAFYYAAKRTPTNMLSCHLVAWLVDDNGDAQANVDAAEVPIVINFKHNASNQQLALLGASGLAAALRDMVLGEPVPENPPIPWSQEMRDELNVRYAIAAARATGDTIDLVTAVAPELPAPPDNGEATP